MQFAEEILPKLADAFHQLETARAAQKEIRDKIKEECQKDDEFVKLDAELTAKRHEVTNIKHQIIEKLKVRDDLQDTGAEINALKELIADYSFAIVEAGEWDKATNIQLPNGKMIMPRIRITYKAEQMKMDF